MSISSDTLLWVIKASYFVAAFLFIFGLQRMSSPRTARGGIIWAGLGMLLATLVSFAYPGMDNYILMIVAIVSSSIIAWYSGRRVAMTGMPQMVALYNGMGGGAAAAIAAVELLGGAEHSPLFLVLGIAGGLIGSVSFTGSLIAFAKLQGWLKGAFRFPGQQWFNLIILLLAIAAGVLLYRETGNTLYIIAFFGLALLFGILMAVPIGGADMPVVISLFNALTGLAVAFEGFVLNNAAMIIAGTVVGAAGTLLTQLMAKAMNRSIGNVLFAGFGDSAQEAGSEIEGSMKAIEANDAAIMMAYANKVIIVPGYGMAVAQAQHKVWELCQKLIDRDVKVIFAIHPVAGRMPGHMNVLLAEAGVPYDLIVDLEEVNNDFATADVALVIGANDVVNPDARNNKSSPIYGMPILNVDQAQNVIVSKRGQGRGFSGVENALFYQDNTRMLYGDAQDSAAKLIQGLKEL